MSDGEDDLECLRIHLGNRFRCDNSDGTSSDSSDSEQDDEFDELYNLFKPTPIPAEVLRKNSIYRPPSPVQIKEHNASFALEGKEQVKKLVFDSGPKISTSNSDSQPYLSEDQKRAEHETLAIHHLRKAKDLVEAHHKLRSDYIAREMTVLYFNALLEFKDMVQIFEYSFKRLISEKNYISPKTVINFKVLSSTFYAFILSELLLVIQESYRNRRCDRSLLLRAFGEIENMAKIEKIESRIQYRDYQSWQYLQREFHLGPEVFIHLKNKEILSWLNYISYNLEMEGYITKASFHIVKCNEDEAYVDKSSATKKYTTENVFGGIENVRLKLNSENTFQSDLNKKCIGTKNENVIEKEFSEVKFSSNSPTISNEYHFKNDTVITLEDKHEHIVTDTFETTIEIENEIESVTEQEIEICSSDSVLENNVTKEIVEESSQSSQKEAIAVTNISGGCPDETNTFCENKNRKNREDFESCDSEDMLNRRDMYQYNNYVINKMQSQIVEIAGGNLSDYDFSNISSFCYNQQGKDEDSPEDKDSSNISDMYRNNNMVSESSENNDSCSVLVVSISTNNTYEKPVIHGEYSELLSQAELKPESYIQRLWKWTRIMLRKILCIPKES